MDRIFKLFSGSSKKESSTKNVNNSSPNKEKGKENDSSAKISNVGTEKQVLVIQPVNNSVQKPKVEAEAKIDPPKNKEITNDVFVVNNYEGKKGEQYYFNKYLDKFSKLQLVNSK